MGLQQRSYQKEIMDDPSVSGEVLIQTLKELKTVNRYLGGNLVTRHGLERLGIDESRSWHVADVGCGAGDMMETMRLWAEKENIPVNLYGIDMNENILEYAAAEHDKKGFQFIHANIFDDFHTASPIDVFTATLFTHHFTDEELVLMIKSLKKKCTTGILINDLHRHPIAYYSISWITRFFSKSSMVKNDAPLSVKRSFKAGDWHRILKHAGCNNYRLSWHWAFRWCLTIWKNEDAVTQ
ncbi:MAG: methyltransferase domain-containing protein [Cyclobacteriaceae bacterium]|nr:methyltransferase domain-containing protein [Cyclobacteriaceae bacterium]MCH8515061.1 methyltransferase domain-containing protein [Cyclobacteriaceae bacterium]